MSLEDYGIIIPAGIFAREVSTTCPKCSKDRKKSNVKCLSVNLDKEVWHCNHCGWSGTSKEARKGFSRLAPKRPDPRPQLTLPHNALEWFQERGISAAVLHRNRIDYGKVFMPQLEREVEAIIFPYFRNGELINRKYRTFPDKQFRMESGCELCLYGLDDMDPEQVIIVEGEADKLALEVAGFKSVVSVPNGAPGVNSKNYSSLFSFLELDIEKIQAVKSYIIATDSDGPGVKLADELARRLGSERCKQVHWADGFKDANEVLTKYGIEEGVSELQWYIKNAQPLPIEGVFDVSDLREEILRLHQFGFDRGYETGWRSLDRLYTVRPGELTVVTGIPGSGKSSWIDALLVNLARLHGWEFGIFSPENLPLEQHMAMIAEKFSGKPFYSKIFRMNSEELNRAIDWVDQHFHWILPGKEDDWTLDKILESAGKLCLRSGIRGLVIDPWNELESLRPDRMSETEYISQSLKRIRTFARHRKVHVWVIVHPTKLYRSEDGRYPVPSLYDAAGSSHWRNKADNGIVIWRDLSDKDQPEVKIYVQKIRFRHIGHRGDAKLLYKSLCATYEEENDG